MVIKPKYTGAPSTQSSRSTGPTSVAGKQRSSKNATKHGFLSKSLMIDGERRQDYNQLFAGLMEAHQPANTAEQVLVEKLAVSLWKQRRLIRVETASINKNLAHNPYDQAFAFPINAERLMKYAAMLDNQYYRAHTALQQLQTMRQKTIDGELIEEEANQETPKPSAAAI